VCSSDLSAPKKSLTIRTMKITLLTMALVASVTQGEVLTLTGENYKEMTAGKTVFIKFFAPWCGHCKAMAPAWEKLAEDWAGHEVALIAEVDCTLEKDLCEEFDVEGFPTLFFGDPISPEIYEGGRDYESMSDFAKDNLGKAFCSVYNITSCADEEKKVIAEFEAKSIDDLVKLVAEIEDKALADEEAFDATLSELQRAYETMVAEYNTKVKIMKKETNYALARAVLLKKDEEASVVGGEL